jgi:hypothetical protein
MAEVDVKVRINIPLPPLIVFPAPPELVVIPETYVYAVPDVDAEIFFYSGWWWRLWEGRWYRSHYYDRGWAHYQSAPAFYRHVPPGWRNDYRAHRWQGTPWDHRRIPYQEMQKNWRGWERNKHWEKQNHWGLRGPGVKGPEPRAYPPKAGPAPQSPQFRDKHPGPGQPQFKDKHRGPGQPPGEFRDNPPGPPSHQGGRDRERRERGRD